MGGGGEGDGGIAGVGADGVEEVGELVLLLEEELLVVEGGLGAGGGHHEVATRRGGLVLGETHCRVGGLVGREVDRVDGCDGGGE